MSSHARSVQEQPPTLVRDVSTVPELRVKYIEEQEAYQHHNEVIPQPNLRVATYNVHFWLDVTGKVDNYAKMMDVSVRA